ncbi:MAG: hypothetical protein NMK33_02530 [Candidatus Cardinium sp.]|nr:MAG: hypothetical protein NMK33_02530 [Candidatus Cardinium sp.]
MEGVVAFGTGVFGTLVICNYFGNQSGMTNLYINNGSRMNGSNLTAVVPFISTGVDTTMRPYINISPTQERAIIHAIQQNPAGLIPNEASSDDITFWDPMVLYDHVLDDLKANDFSINRIEYWLAKGLHIDAKNKQGRTLCMYAALYSKLDAFQRIIE